MTKPIFIQIISTGWNGSSPFAYTLQRTLKYAHFGYSKTSERQLQDTSIIEKVLNNTWENWNYNRGHFMNHSEDLEPLKDFPLSHYKKFIKSPKYYIDFYTALYNHVSTKGYKAVAQFKFPKKSDLTHDILTNYFDIKCILLLRDPVRRALSHCLRDHKKLIPNMDNYFIQSDYINQINYYYQFVNYLILPMEELWEDDGTTKQKLSTFLGTPVHSLWPNLYSPDIGHHLQWDLEKYYCPTPCQIIGQSSLEITPEIYNFYRNKYSYIYDKWLDYFGSLPLHWGEPIDYDKNLQTYPHYNLKKPLRDFL